MKKTISENDFIQAFIDYGRKDNFSYDALRAIFAYLEECEEECETEIELDPIAICCEYTEMAKEDIENDYALDGADPIEYLNENTFVIAQLDDEHEHVIFQNF
jgi:hypothetical protein